jgi:phosphatidylglycerophosphate synthase
MDPIADKVFVVTALLPIVDAGWAPWWLAYALILREFLVTALRSIFEERELSLRSTYLAKVKTWVQMLALALAVAVHVVSRSAMIGFLVAVPAVALLLAVVWMLRGRRWRGAWIFSGSFAVTAACYIAFDAEIFLTAVYLATAIITWVSAFDYVALAIRDLRGTRVGDVVRIAGATLVPILAVLDLHLLSVPAWAIIATVAIEVAHGGLDNLLAHHEATAPAWAWAGRTLGTAALLGAGLLWPRFAEVFAVGALTVTLAGTVAEFWRNRAYYLEDRPKKKRKTVAAPAIVR